MKKIFTLTIAIIMLCSVIALPGCSGIGKAPVYVEIEMEAGGIIKLELYPDIAPITVQNFVKLANDGFYDGLTFHRIFDGFMIQGGQNPNKTTDTIKGEFSQNGVKNDLKHERGVISMARTNVFDSASTQFFIMHADNNNLDGAYAAFGRVISGMDVVDAIVAKTERTWSALDNANTVPVNPPVIKTIRVVK